MSAIPLLGPNDDPEWEDIRLAAAQFEQFSNEYFYAKCRPVDEYKKLEELGKGNSGVVFKAQHNVTGDIVALKKLRVEADGPNGVHKDVYRELNFVKQLKHDNVVLLKDIVVGKKLKNVFLVMEYCDEDLSKVIEQMKIPFSQDEIKNVMSQLFTGLEYLHCNYVVHRDINPSNLLINQSGVVKISDFGSTRKCSPQMTPNIGTLWYRAPEILFGFATYTNAVDIWSAGCIFGELLKHEPMFPSSSQMTVISNIIALLGTPNDQIMPGYTSTPLAKSYDLIQQPFNTIRKVFKEVGLSEGAVVLLKLVLAYNPQKRPSAQDCLKCNYLLEEPTACDNLTLKLSIMQKKMEHEDK